VIEAAVAQQAVSTRPSKRLKHSSGLMLRLPPQMGNQKTTAMTREYENREGTNPGSAAPTAALPTILAAEPTDHDVLVLDEHELFQVHEKDNDPHDMGQQDVHGGNNVVNDQIEANDINDRIEDNDVNDQIEDNDAKDQIEDNDAKDQIEDNDVHVEGGDGRGVDLGMCECEELRNTRNILM
jgi:hypothetical protein